MDQLMKYDSVFDVGCQIKPTRQRRLRIALKRGVYSSGFINSSIEPFAGKLHGVKVAYEYVRGGALVGAQTYYLQANNRTIYVLRFTAPPDVLKGIRDQIESIARSFSVL